ncbi:MAG TPA: GerMN domain-containing protein [Acidimicrobiales bacterium]
MRRAVTAAVALALTLVLGVLAGCGVSTDDQPQEISGSNVPDAFDEPTTTNQATAQPGEEVQVFLLHDEGGEVKLVPRPRHVARTPTDAAVLEALLLEGPTTEERERSITTAIPRSTRLASPPERLPGGILRIDLSAGFFEVAGDDLRNAYAQVVCTANYIEGVRAVEFAIEGERVGAFDGAGQSSNRPVRCDDYAALLPDDGDDPDTTDPDRRDR